MSGWWMPMSLYELEERLRWSFYPAFCSMKAQTFSRWVNWNELFVALSRYGIDYVWVQCSLIYAVDVLLLLEILIWHGKCENLICIFKNSKLCFDWMNCERWRAGETGIQGHGNRMIDWWISERRRLVRRWIRL